MKVFIPRLSLFVSLLVLFLCLIPQMRAQTGTAQISGLVIDSSGAALTHASVLIVNRDTGVSRAVQSNSQGLYIAPALQPGHYRITVKADGFKTLVTEEVILNVAQEASVSFQLQIGAEDQTITVDGSGLTINTTDASVSTVVDRKFVENMPLNGRSFQDLISMTPGVVTQSPQTTSQTPGKFGDFSINGQRTESNYYTIDGVSANVGTGTGGGGTEVGQTGVLAASSALGTTQSLISIDALQEFRIQSSSYSAESGRSPGGQISFLSRSGTNSFHGSAFDYLRNNFFDANDWFNNNTGKPKTALRQNDFGGTLGGPVWLGRLYQGKDRTFFFGSYEGLRLTVPQAATIQYVPDLFMRQQAPAAIRPILNAFPLPSTGGIDYGTASSPSLAQFIQAYSVPGTIDSTSVRFDHVVDSKLAIFFRFGDTQSSTQSRSLAVLTNTQMNTSSYTLGTTYSISSRITNETRLGYARGNSASGGTLDNFGGATPIDLGAALGLSSGVGSAAQAYVNISGIGNSALLALTAENKGRQWNFVDTLNLNLGKHQLKVGYDYRRIKTAIIQQKNYIYGGYTSAAAVLANVAATPGIAKYGNSTPLYNQTAIFAQDEWRISQSLTASLGLRWEVAPAPTSASANKPYAVIGDPNQPSTLTVASLGTPLWQTYWYSFAPRLGIAWQAHNAPGKETVIRIGGGVFLDTGNEAGFAAFQGIGFSASRTYSNVALPLTTAQQNFSITTAPPYTLSVVYPSHLQVPYTNEWNTSIEQALGHSQSLSISYIGAAGRRQLQQQQRVVSSLNSSFGTVYYFPGGVTSSYQALQTKFQRQVSHGIQTLVSYTWAHSLDFGSNYSSLPLTYGNSDFDVRHNLQAGVSWELPSIKAGRFASAVANGWGVDTRLVARTGFPITLRGNLVTDAATGNRYYTNVNFNASAPLYIYGSTYPGGRILNKGAFSLPTGSIQGNAPRNFVRGFGSNQVNFAVRRRFAITDQIAIQFRAEAFNILNHPNFGYVDPVLTDATFGYATKMLNQSLGTVSSQYQQGGPRSMQFALKCLF